MRKGQKEREGEREKEREREGGREEGKRQEGIRSMQGTTESPGSQTFGKTLGTSKQMPKLITLYFLPSEATCI